MKDKHAVSAIEVREPEAKISEVFVLGETPLILQAMSAKAKRELLLPARKSRASRATSLKHDPVKEFRESARLDKSADGLTRILFPSPAFRKAMQTAALDIPGATKAEIVRLVRVVGYSVPVWGIPRLRMDVVRQAGINRSPDVRTRACLEYWCCLLRLQYRVPNLNLTTILNLLAAAGMSVGIGDYRQEKGAGDFGLFTVVDESDERIKPLIEGAGRQAQDEAFKNPVAYDADTEELWKWYEQEVVKQGRKEVA